MDPHKLWSVLMVPFLVGQSPANAIFLPWTFLCIGNHVFSQTKRKVSSLNSPLHPGEVQISHPATHWKAFDINLPYSPDTSFVFFFLLSADNRKCFQFWLKKERKMERKKSKESAMKRTKCREDRGLINYILSILLWGVSHIYSQ